jgi:hypothetical protein
MLRTRRTATRLLPVVMAMIAAMLASATLADAAVGGRTTTRDVPVVPKATHGAMPAPGLGADGLTALAVPGNNLPSGAPLVSTDGAYGPMSTADADVAGESSYTCSDPDAQPQAARAFINTVWYRFTGTGGTVAIDTFGSNYDTMLGIFPANNLTGSFSCDDDPGGGSSQARLVVPTTKGAQYMVLVGGCCGSTGSLLISFLGSDHRAVPSAFEADGSALVHNIDASVDSGELTSCGGTPFAHTVWWRFTTADPGNFKFSATSPDFLPTATIYPVGSTSPLVPCHAGTPSNPVVTTGARLRRGTYLVQVGSVTGGSALDMGVFTYNVSFAVILDEDGDHWNRPQDCVDDPAKGGAAIHPGVWDKKDGINNDCDRFIDEDADHDLHDAIFAGGDDCAPDDYYINPGRSEIYGNDVNEDCKDGPGYKQLKTDLKSGILPGAVFTLHDLSLYHLKPGSKIKVTCRGSGCVHRSVTKRAGRSTADLMKRVGKIAFRRGTKLEIRVTKRYWIGRYWAMYLKHGSVREHPKCIRPHETRLRSCA